MGTYSRYETASMFSHHESRIAELEHKVNKYYQQTLDDEIQINELLQTIQEIKEICDYENEYNSIGIDDYKSMIKDIVNLITKAEVGE